MKVSLYLSILNKLNSLQFTKLSKFILNNNNKNNDAFKLLKYLNKHKTGLPNKINQSIIKQKAGLKFSAQKTLKTLAEQTEKFILQNQEETNIVQKINKQLSLLNYYLNNNLHEIALKKIKQIEKEISNTEINHFEFFHIQYKLSFAKTKYKFAIDKRLGNLSFDEVNQHLDQYYVTRKLMLESFSKNRLNTIGDKTVSSNFQSIRNQSNFNNIVSNPYTIIWEKAYQLLSKPSSTINYKELKTLVEKKLNVIRIEEATPLIAYLMNSAHLIFKNVDFYNELFDLYSLQANKQQMIMNEIVNPQLYKNMITVCLKLNKIKQAQKTLEKYKTDLPKANQLAYYNYNKATILFAQKKYAQALDLLLPLELEDIFYMLGAKRLSSMIYYELYEMDLLESYLNAFRVYMHRIKNKLATDRLTAHRNFINTLTKIAYLEAKQWRRKKKLIELVKNFDFVSERNWLIEKLEEIK